MCVYMTSHRMRVSRQGSSVGQSMRFIPAVSRVQISPLLPESRTPEAHRASGVFCCPRLFLSPRNPPFPISKGSRAQGHPGSGQTGDFHSVPSPAGGTAIPRSLSGFSSPAACVRIPFLYKGSSAVQRAACCQDAAQAGNSGHGSFPACVHERPGSLPGM